ncbi:pyridoxamine 5'-phosphate oxidase family protein [Erythrobacter ani]|uniref:Pyridoxamine 5'-phosphate oxidase family protein n=1 Tax=Erythrobacter ani TaxID=2827235 RepID=A0ABS6SNT2_9SPHN|nr:pyridoxamine 5'-phosphate oxidase family protein [Erythrobacter ani]MBV7266167.1 pyridoxamine 5'-phosphate oxidase family protein [Erythrobacter ani]
MTYRTLSDIAAKLKSVDIAMLVTKTGADGKIAARPMSNNGDVSAEDGTTYHFATDDGRIDDDLRRSSECGATYSGGEFYCAVQGTGTIIRDRATHEQHWVKDLEKWFDQGLDTEGLILIEVSPARIDWWEGREQGEITVNG